MTAKGSATRTCPVCSAPVREDFLYTHVRTDLDILNELMRRNPSWVLPDGSCPRGIEELRASRRADRVVAARQA
ncbi:MAG TPA: hypothetical protein VIG69_02485 [Candidatus Methylomirabilis sp.]|jgi:hypothetical protein